MKSTITEKKNTLHGFKDIFEHREKSASLKTENSVLTASGACFTGFLHPQLPRRLEKVPCSSEVVEG